MIELVAADIGGTHSRFALATVEGGRVVALSEPVMLPTADFADLPSAWAAFATVAGRPLPRRAAFAIASPVGAKAFEMTNGRWMIRPEALADQIGVDAPLLLNDFAAVGHAVAHASDDDLVHLCGPERALPAKGNVTICGPGTGLGVAQLWREGDDYHVIATEGGHIAYAPDDPIEDEIVARLRARHGRVSAERIVSGSGLVAIYQTLAEVAGQAAALHDDIAVWTAALAGTDSLAGAALDRLLLALGSVAGDLALAHGAEAVVIAGGLGYRLRDRLKHPGFAARFVAKGRFRARMEAMPVKLVVHPHAGVFGAAAAFAQRALRLAN